MIIFTRIIFTRNILLTCIFFLSACTVGPNYKRPVIATPLTFKEAPKGWKIAQPQDQFSRGQWWKIFNDSQLCQLEDQLNAANQNIAVAEAQYQQARALINTARAAYFPTITGSAAITRQKSTSLESSSSAAESSAPVTTRSIVLDAAWEPDLWGGIRRSVEASKASAQASAAQLASIRLSAQATLAQAYFQLRALDTDQQLLDKTVRDYQKALKLTQNRYTAGVAGRTDIIQAQTQLDIAQSQAINNGINRAQFEHAIAVLIGQPPASFTLPHRPLVAKPPEIPLQIPSTLLERRPDIAQAERLMAEANANIGIATAAYFPNLDLSTAPTVSLLPSHLGWTIGSKLAETLFDGGLRKAQTAAARAGYAASVANYRQTVLAAFQDVEDNLVALRLLAAQAVIQNKAAADARQALSLITNQYKAGTAAYADVIAAQTITYTAEKNAADITGLRMSATVGLIKALGGGWNASA